MLFSTAILLLSSALSFTLAADPPQCGNGKPPCPAEFPCCGGLSKTCGNGYVCLGACDPRHSFALDSCAAMPICKSGTTSLDSADKITAFADYLGDADKQPWSYVGNITSVDGHLRAQMFPRSGGTTISSSHYVWYGKISLKMKSSHSQGVISTFILFSSVEDEVDYEFVGNNLTNAQTNFYWQGLLDYSKYQPVDVSNTYENEHEFTIDWKEDSIAWGINGQVVRTVKKSDTWDDQKKLFKFPQSPSRVQFGLWPGGDNQNEGTRKWAGGYIDWNSPDITQSPGYYFTEYTSVTIECYDPPSGASVSGNKAYVYTGREGLEANIAVTNNNTILESTDGTGSNPWGSKPKPGSSSSLHSSSQSSSSASSRQLLSGASIAASSSSSSSPSSRTVLSGASLASSSASSSPDASESSPASNSDSGDKPTSTPSSALPTASEPSTPAQQASGSGSASGSSAKSSGEKKNSGVKTLVSSLMLLVAPVAMLL